MTNEEAINRLKNTAWLGTNKDREATEQAVELAIEALSNSIMESSNDVIESQNDVIKKPRTVRYKLHKPIEYVTIEFDEEENITDMEHYHEVVRCKDCKYRKKNKFCLEHNRYEKDDDGYCHYGERGTYECK